ncbi:MAG: peptide/nickel transport system substrate-binding protein [Nocardioidaceae bacterium]|jgi:peptide/nickel transport system substrate-binding protein|nr:peptide/nickel transport system substrate-binding protein [Nocardioidaceae bacterium]
MTGLKRPLPAAALAVAAVLTAATLGACSGAGSGTGSSSHSGVLTIQGDAGNPTLVENFNPFSTTQLEGTRLIYEPLEIPSTVDGTFTPFLATGHQFTSPTTLVYSIRSGVKWSDGKPFTSADVAFTFNLLKKTPALDTTGVWSQLKSVTASGDKVTVTFKAPDVPFAATVSQVPIVPQHLWSSIAKPDTTPNTKPVGTGPFTLKSFAPTQYTFAKNTSYWQASKIAPTEVDFPAQSSNQSTNQLDVSSGKFDWSYNYLPNVQQTYVSKAPSTRSYWFPPGGTIGLFLNLTKAPYNNVDFRKGLSLALDRKAVAQKAVNGYTDAASLSGLILPNEQKWLDPSLPNNGVVAQNLSAAKAEFAKAGYTTQGGKLVHAGKQASMTLVMPNNFSDWIAAAKEVSTQLSAAGISVHLDLPQYAQYEKEIGEGTFDTAIGGFGGSGSPYTDFNNALNSAYAAPLNTATVNNFERFKSPAVDQALAKLARATGEAQQKQATYALENVMYSQVPIVLMYYGGSWGLFQTSNFTGWPSQSDPYTLPTPYNYNMLLVVSHLTKA